MWFEEKLTAVSNRARDCMEAPSLTVSLAWRNKNLLVLDQSEKISSTGLKEEEWKSELAFEINRNCLVCVYEREGRGER